MKEERVSKIFMEDSQIKGGWLDLNINNDMIIPVSYLNSRFFYDLLSLVQVLNNYCTIGCRNLYLEIDCEGTLAYISIYTFSEGRLPEDVNYDALDDVKVSVIKECFNKENQETYEKQYNYVISKKEFMENIITFVENKIDEYNVDFCCDDVADKISKTYVEIIKRGLIDRYRLI